jgi:aconitase A
MGVLPLQFPEGVTAQTLGLTGREVFDVLGLATSGYHLPFVLRQLLS